MTRTERSSLCGPEISSRSEDFRPDVINLHLDYPAPNVGICWGGSAILLININGDGWLERRQAFPGVDVIRQLELSAARCQ